MKTARELDSVLNAALHWRRERGLLEGGHAQALRILHGPGEVDPRSPWSQIAVDVFGVPGNQHLWVTQWEDSKGERLSGEARESVEKALKNFGAQHGFKSCVALWRPDKGIPEKPVTVFGSVPEDGLLIEESGMNFRIRLSDTRHPGLFLDHAPLRQWLQAHAEGWTVLNTFAYTGSLSVAARSGGASHVTTLDLSAPTVRWAEENWLLNGFEKEAADFIAGDVFEWLPRLRKNNRQFDCVILDPPSFARSQKMTFSTSKDLAKLHELAQALVKPGGVMITSINSRNVSWERYRADVLKAAKSASVHWDVLCRIDAPASFPNPLEREDLRYLKGWILRRRI